MTKEELLQELMHETFVALQPSAIHGIGVFAIADIPKGCRTLFSKNTGGWITLSFEEAEQLPAHSREFIETYYLYDEENYFIPDHGCKVMDMASYLKTIPPAPISNLLTTANTSKPSAILRQEKNCWWIMGRLWKGWKSIEGQQMNRRTEEQGTDEGNIILLNPEQRT